MEEKDRWLFSSVAEHGSTTAVLTGLFSQSPFQASRDNLPIGTNAGTDYAPLPVTGPYIKLRFARPKDVSGVFVWDGTYTIARKEGEFCRDYTEIASGEAYAVATGAVTPGSYAEDEYHDDFVVLDQPLTPGTFYYYTLFLGNTLSTLKVFDKQGGIAYNYPLKQRVRTDGTPFSRQGDILFKYMPRNIRALDAKHGDTLYRVLQSLGRVMDAVEEEVEVIKNTRFNIKGMDAKTIPYLDHQLGWPTGAELSALRKRKETGNAMFSWIAKGTLDALSFVLQSATGWNVSLYEGWKWVVTTFDPHSSIYYTGGPPLGWVPSTDGNWSELMAALPFNGTPDVGVLSQAFYAGTPKDKLTYTHTAENWWQDTPGVGIFLEPAYDVNGEVLDSELVQVLVNRIYALAPLFLLYYAKFSVIISILSQEEGYNLLGTDEYWDTLDIPTNEVYNVLSGEEDLLQDQAPSVLRASTYPGPGYSAGNLLGHSKVWLYHTWLDLLGEQEEMMPQFISMVLDETVDQANPSVAVGQMGFDAGGYDVSNTSFFFEATVTLSGASLGSGLAVTCELWDVTNGVQVAGTTLSSSVAGPTALGSIALTVGSASGNLQDTDTIYEVRVSLTGASDATDKAVIGSAGLSVA